MDVAFVVDEGVTHERLVQCMTSAGGKLLEDVRLFDVYRDEARVGAGKKSMAYALTYRARRPHAHQRGGRQGSRAPGQEGCPSATGAEGARAGPRFRRGWRSGCRPERRLARAVPAFPSSNDRNAGGWRVVGSAVLSAGPSRLLLLSSWAQAVGRSRRISRGESGKHHIWRACGYRPAVRQIFFSAEIRHQGSSFLVIAGGNRSQSGFSALSCKFFDFVACLNRTRVLPTWSFLLGDTSRRSACLSAIREMPGRLCRVVPRSQKTCTTTPVRR